MNEFNDLGWLLIEWWFWMLIPFLLGLAIGWWIWRRPWKASLEEHATEVRHLNNQERSLQTDLDGVNGKLKEQNRVISGLKSDLDTKSSELGKRQIQLTSAETDRDRRSVKMGELEGYLDSKSATISELQLNLDASDEKISDFEGELLGLRATLADTSKGKNTLSADLTAARSQVGNLEVSLAGANAKLGSLEGQLAGTNAKLGSLEGSLSGSNARVGELEGQLGGASAKLGSIEGELDGANIRIAKLEEKVAEATVSSHDSDLSAELAARKARIVNLEAELASSGGQLGQLNASLGTANLSIIDLRTRLTNQEAAAPVPVVGVPIGDLEIPGDDDSFAQRLRSVSGERDLGYVDDLQLIRGVGPKMEAVLNRNGLTTFYQVALLDGGAVDDLETRIETFPGRVRRDDWVPQAGRLHEAEHQEAIGDRVVIAWYERAEGDQTHLQMRLDSIASGRDLTYADDLKPIVGIGQKMSTGLNHHGIRNHYQLALLDEPSLEELEGLLGISSGRIRRENWIPQAAQLHFEIRNEEIYDLTEIEGEYSDEFERQMATAARGVKLDYTDDLTEIKGVGKLMESLLHDNGIQTFLQVSHLDAAGVAALNDRLDDFPGRIERDQWVSQAGDLHKSHHG